MSNIDYKLLIDNTNQVVFKLDNEGKLIYINKYWQCLTGFDVDESINRKLKEYIFIDDQNRFVDIHNKLLDSKLEYILEEMRIVNKEGNVNWVQIYMKNVDGVVGNLVDISEKKQLKKELMRMHSAANHGLEDLRAAEEKIMYMHYHDHITDLLNLKYLNDIFDKRKNSAKAENKFLTFIYIDIDKFKYLNDTLGHANGDVVLKKIGNRLINSVDEDDVVIKMSGDEFIILAEFTHEEDIDKLINYILNALKEPMLIDGNKVFITVSMGISIYSRYCDNLEMMIKGAETAMYRAKTKGGNRYKYFKKFMDDENIRYIRTVNQLRQAVENEEFFLLYQPRVEVSTGKILGLEALIRWNSPELGIVSPVEFISIAEKSGLIVPIGEWVLKEAWKQLKIWHDEGHKVHVAVNVSAKQFEDVNFAEKVKGIVHGFDIDPHYLEIEITENSIMEDISKTIYTINELKDIGVDIAIDDFGTGFSSLSYIQQFDPTILKIDRSFIKDVPSNQNDISIILAIINMTRSLNIRTVAEGVETIEQFELLRENNCDEIQGYLFSKPESVKTINNLLKHNMNFPFTK